MDSVIKLSNKPTGQFWKIPVLFEDDHLLALDKPAGLAAQPDPFVDDPNQPSLMGLLHSGIATGKPWAKERGLEFLKNPYSMDTDASGLFLLSKSSPVQSTLVNRISAEEPFLTYLVLVHGPALEESFQVSGRLAPHKEKPGLMQLNRPGGKKSVTNFQWVESIGPFGLVHACPLTHRRHQIRVHLQNRRMRVCGDPLYAGMRVLLSRLKPGYRFRKDRDERPLLNRAALHAEFVRTTHPVTGQPLHIECPFPKDLEVTLKYLRKYAGGGPAAAEEADSGG